jgi:hypothetical protein
MFIVTSQRPGFTLSGLHAAIRQENSRRSKHPTKQNHLPHDFPLKILGSFTSFIWSHQGIHLRTTLVLGSPLARFFVTHAWKVRHLTGISKQDLFVAAGIRKKQVNGARFAPANLCFG